MTFHSGRKGTCTINGTEIPIISWRVNASAEMVRFRNSKTGKFSLVESTFLPLTFNVVLDFDFDAPPYVSPLNIVPGSSLTTVKLFINGTADTTNCWTIPSAVVSSTPQDVSVEGKIGTSFAAEANGTYSMPGGVTPT
jgi:hypothetical protein